MKLIDVLIDARLPHLVRLRGKAWILDRRLVDTPAAFAKPTSKPVQDGVRCGGSTTNNKLFALRASDGAVLWTFNGTCTSNVDWIVGMPYVDYARNRVYVASRAGGAGSQSSFWVIDTLDGSLIDSLALGHVETSPTLSADGATIYVGNLAGTLYAVNASTLAVKWSLDVGTPVRGFVWRIGAPPGACTSAAPLRRAWHDGQRDGPPKSETAVHLGGLLALRDR